MKDFTAKERNFINEFLLFVLSKDPVIVYRILGDMKMENDLQDKRKYGNAPDIAIKIVKKVRKPKIIKQLLNVPKSDLLTALLDTSLLQLLVDLTNEFAKVKVQGGGSKVKVKSCYKRKIGLVMSEFKRGKLKTSSGLKVKNRSQAIAIAINSAKREC